MSDFPLGFEQIHPTSWVYLSSLLTIGLFFKFGRAWSMRNVDLILLILLAPGLVMIHTGVGQQKSAERAQQSAGEKPNPAPDKPTLPLPDNNPTLPIPRDNELRKPAADGPGTDADDKPEDEPPVEPAIPLPPAGDPLPETSDSSLSVTGAPDDGQEDHTEPAEKSAAVPDANKLLVSGYVWLFCVGVVILLRMLLDPMMVRRPLLEPNLTTGGLMFLGLAMFVFLTVNVAVGKPPADRLMIPQADVVEMAEQGEEDAQALGHGPGSPLIRLLRPYETFTKVLAVLSHLAIVVGLIGIGYCHFDNVKTGIGIAALYLMLPYTAQLTARIDHVLPAVFLVWGVLLYRRPLLSGAFLGLATGIFYYPLFMLPLWVSFYWQRGLMRFAGGLLLMVAVSAGLLIFTSSQESPFLYQLQQTFGVWLPKMEGLLGVWGPGGWNPAYRIPILAAFIALSATFALWPAQKNLGTLLSCSAAIMIGAQFWHGFGGGLYMGWYLPLALLTFFRPNLEDRIAQSVLGDGWFSRRSVVGGSRVDQAA